MDKNHSVNAGIWALVVFSLASLTDMLDGWSARKLKQETSTGKFLDPLADKLLVISVLVTFLIFDPLIPLWMVLVIVGRDLLITLMRFLAIRKGKELRTSRFGKVKTAFQMFSIVLIIMVFIFRSTGVDIHYQFAANSYSKIKTVYNIYISNHPNMWLIIGPYCLMAFITLMTAFSGLRYTVSNWRLFMPPYFNRKEIKE